MPTVYRQQLQAAVVWFRKWSRPRDVITDVIGDAVHRVADAESSLTSTAPHSGEYTHYSVLVDTPDARFILLSRC